MQGRKKLQCWRCSLDEWLHPSTATHWVAHLCKSLFTWTPADDNNSKPVSCTSQHWYYLSMWLCTESYTSRSLLTVWSVCWHWAQKRVGPVGIIIIPPCTEESFHPRIYWYHKICVYVCYDCLYLKGCIKFWDLPSGKGQGLTFPL